MMPQVHRCGSSDARALAWHRRGLARTLTIVPGFALWLVSADASAAGATAAPTASSGLQAVENALQGVQGNLGSIGSQLFAYLAFLSLVWWAAQLILKGGDITDTFGGFLRSVFLFGLAYFFMLPYAEGQTPLVWFVGKLTTAVTSALTGNANGDVSDIAAYAFTSLYTMIAILVKDLMQPFSSSSGFLGGMEAIGVLFANLPMVLFLGLAIVLLWFAGITLFVMATIGLVMFKVADIFAPLFIPFLVLPVVSWLFDGWLRFLLSAAMYKMAGAAIVLLGSAVLKQLSPLLLGTPNWGQMTIAGMVVAGLAFSLLYVMLQLPSIAQGLISGHATVQMQRLMGSVSRAGQLTAGASLAGAGGALIASGRGFAATPGLAKAGLNSAKGAIAGTAISYNVGGRGVGGAAQVAKDAGAVAGAGGLRLGKGALSTLGRGAAGAPGAMSRAGTGLMNKGRRG